MIPKWCKPGQRVRITAPKRLSDLSDEGLQHWLGKIGTEATITSVRPTDDVWGAYIELDVSGFGMYWAPEELTPI